MLRVKIKRYICAALSILICLGSTSCGKHLTVVDEYGRQDDSSGNTTQLSTGGDAYYEQSGGESIQDIFGPSISWRDDFTVGDIPVKVSAYYDVPDIDGVNVFHNKKIGDGLDQEDAIVKSLFGDTAEKLEEIKYINEYDYLPMMYEYREIVREFNMVNPDVGDDDPEKYYIDHSVITASTGEVYKWKDENNLYIHMYEGQYEGTRFGLLLAYNFFNHCKYIFFEPISIKDYYPEYDFKSLLVAGSNNFAGQAQDLDNKCSENIEMLKQDTEALLSDTFRLGDFVTVTEDADQYKTLNVDNLASFVYYGYGTNEIDPGSSVLMFSDADYISTLKKGAEGQSVDYNILADQRDLYTEYSQDHDMDIYSFIMSESQSANADVVEPEFTVDGYALYVMGGYSSLMDMYSMFMPSGNTGIVKYTSKGLYSVNLKIYDETLGVTENVKLLEFDKLEEAFKAGLAERDDFSLERFKPENLPAPTYVSIGSMGLTYYAYSENEDSDEYDYIPAWQFLATGDGAMGNPGTIYVNAIDGSIIDIQYWGIE